MQSALVLTKHHIWQLLFVTMNDKILVFAVISHPILFAHVGEAQNIGDSLAIVPDICFVSWYCCFLVHF